MADIRKIFPETKIFRIETGGFFFGKPSLRRKTSGGGKKRRSYSGKPGSPAPDYLTIPILTSVPEKIESCGDIELPCRMLAALDKIYPITVKDFSNPKNLLLKSLDEWVKTFMPQQVYDHLSMSLQICGSDCIDCDYTDSETDAQITFEITEFTGDYCPLGEVLANYDKTHPGLGKYILRMLSDCPVSIGTPENVYEFISYSCWYNEENEEKIWNERYHEYIDMGESEGDAKEYVNEQIPVSYAEFEEYVPEWSFCRKERKADYSGEFPAELQKLHDCRERWCRLKRVHFHFPNYLFPPVIVGLDRKSYDFLCDALDRVGNDIAQCESDYGIGTLKWHLQSENTRQILVTLLELRQALEYFSACMEFLLPYRQEYTHA